MQQIDANIIYPKFVGEKLGLNLFLTIFATMIGGAFWGLWDMILSIPIASIMKLYIDEKITDND